MTIKDNPSSLYKSGKKSLQNSQSLRKSGSFEIDQANQKKWVLLVFSVIILTTIAIYFKALKFDFLISWDDGEYILENSAIKELGWGNIKQFFTQFYVSNYQPLTMLMYAAEYKAMGNSPLLFHLNSIILHILNTCLVFLFIRKISPKNIFVALITAAFFAVHPMHIESVAWISERKDVLYSFFFLIALIQYTNYLNSKRGKYLIYTGIFFVLSCLSKSAAVILPLVLVLLDYYLNRKFDWKMVLKKIPFLIISVIFGIVAIYSQRTALHPETFISAPDHFLIITDALSNYLTKSVVPLHLSAIYPYPNLSGSSLSFRYYLSVLFVGLVLYGVWYSRKWGKDVIFGFGFFILTIILVLQIIAVGNATMADRYTYIPYIGLFFIAGKLYEYSSQNLNLIYKRGYLFALIIGFFIFTVSSSNRLLIWKDGHSFFRNVLDQYPECPLAYNNRGSFYYYLSNQTDSYSNKQREKYVEKAIEDFKMVVNLNKNFKEIYTRKAYAEYSAKNYTAAIEDFNQSIKLNPQNTEVYYNRGLAYAMSKDYAAAVKDFSKSIEANLNYQKASVYFNRGLANYMLKDYYGAINDFTKTIEGDPKYKGANFSRGLAYNMIKNYDLAIKDFSKAIEIEPSNIDAYKNRSVLNFVLKDYKSVLLDYDKIIELNSKDTVTIKNRQIVKSFLDSSMK